MGTRSRWSVVTSVSVLVAATMVLSPPASATAPGDVSNVEVVGHDPLSARGMNAAPALYNDPGSGRTYIYIGDRTDSSLERANRGVLIVDVTDPSAMQTVGAIAPPAENGVGETSRELRVWPERKLLLVLSFTCSSLIHACDPVTDWVTGTAPRINFYDLTDPEAPALVHTYSPSLTPHELFLWIDLVNAGRALLYMSTPSSTVTGPNLVVADISAVPDGEVVEIARWTGNADFEREARQFDDVRLHSMGVSADGTRTYLAYLGGGFLVLDSSTVTHPAVEVPAALTLRTAPADRVHWGNPGTHSSVKVPGTKSIAGQERVFALTTDEVYGELTTPLALGKGKHGCPWGWVRLIDITDESHPVVVGEYKIAENEMSFCTSPEGALPTTTVATSYASHNPTVLNDLAIVTWHSGGVQFIDISDPAAPAQAGEFVPLPLASVDVEDPALSLGTNKAVMWSYPILNRQAGETIIYVVDLRNGLYALRYTGPHADALDQVTFLEGNSNLGDAAALDGFIPGPPGGDPPPGLTFGAFAPTTMHLDSPSTIGELDRAGEFGGAADGPVLTLTPPEGSAKVQHTSRFGNPGLSGNPLLSYGTFADPVRLQGAPSVGLWLSAPSAQGVTTVPLSIELFVDGAPVYGHADENGNWLPISFPVDIGPAPSFVELPLPELDHTALSSLTLQLGVAAATADAQPKMVELLYGSPDFDSTLSATMAFPV